MTTTASKRRKKKGAEKLRAQTYRNDLVRHVVMARAITMTIAAQEMETTKSNLHKTLLSATPRAITVDRVRRWLVQNRKHLPEGARIASNTDLMG